MGGDFDPINRPKHYAGHESGVECIEITEWLGFNLGNAFKYLFRRNEKGSLKENLEKAVWYLEREKKRTGVWIEEVPQGTIEALREKCTRVVGYEPSYVGSAMSHIIAAAVAEDDIDHIDDALVSVRAEIRRVCK